MDVSKLRPADDIRLEQAKEKIKAMNKEYWISLAKEIRADGDMFNSDPNPRTEYEAQKSVLKFEIAEIKYYGYESIINSPNRQQEITAGVLKKIQEKEKQIEVLKRYSEFIKIDDDIPFKDEEKENKHEQMYIDGAIS